MSARPTLTEADTHREAAQQGDGADEAQPTSELRSLSPVLGGWRPPFETQARRSSPASGSSSASGGIRSAFGRCDM
jgi:hypothetical protein